MNWTLFDYVFAAVLLGTLGGLVGLVLLTSRNPFYRAGVALAALTGFAILWSGGAVGIVGDPDNDANLAYYSTLLVAIIGALIARFQARGMAQAMFVTAFALAAIGVVAFTLRLGVGTETNWPRGILIGSGGFGAMFATSGLLFLHAAKTQARPA